VEGDEEKNQIKIWKNASLKIFSMSGMACISMYFIEKQCFLTSQEISL